MSVITTQVQDAVSGKPASRIAIRLEKREGNTWVIKGAGTTHADGRCRGLASRAAAGTYRLIFGTGDYLERNGRKSIYPEISVTFECNGKEPYHLPLLLHDNSYTIYRGS